MNSLARTLTQPLVHRPLRPGAITKRQKRLALGIALVADLLQLALFPLFVAGGLSPLDTTLDVVVALSLIVTLGWRWRTGLALVIELMPGLALFPTWTA